MFRVFQEEKVVTACMFTLLAVSIFLRIVQGLLYQNMIKESDNMATTENKMLKQCKLKFANCYQMSNGVANIPVFVDKFLNRMKWGPFTFETLYHLSGQAMLLSVVSAGAGICRSIMAGRTLGDILPFYIVSFFGLYLYFSISTVVDVKKKKRVLKVNLVDYLENHLSPRIDITRQDIEMLYGDTGTEGRTVSGRVSAGGRNRSRQGRRTVELMPIGIRQPVDRLTLDEARNIEMENGSGSSMEETIKPDSQPQDSAAVTEEELEALLKEFLAN
ncbi:MAG: hypothetical protein NC121_16325 [Blautia sp.]|nr:hypothetical protein [Blautia sp.]